MNTEVRTLRSRNCAFCISGLLRTEVVFCHQWWDLVAGLTRGIDCARAGATSAIRFGCCKRGVSVPVFRTSVRTRRVRRKVDDDAAPNLVVRELPEPRTFGRSFQNYSVSFAKLLLQKVGEQRNGERFWLLFLSMAAAFSCHLVFIHVAANIIHTLPDWHAANISGKAPAPLQFRWLSFYTPEFLIKTLNIGVVKAYLVIRVTCLTLSFYLAAMITRRLVSEPLAPTVVILALTLYYAASIQSHFQPSEEPNLLIFSLFIWLILRESRVWLLAIVFTFGVINKDTVGFLIPFLFVYRFLGQKKLTDALTQCSLLSVIFLLGYIGLRMYYGIDRPYLGGLWQYSRNLDTLLNARLEAFMWSLPTILSLAFIFNRWKEVPVVVRCFVPAAVLFIVGHFLISRIDEFRTYTALALLLWPGIVAAVYSKEDTNIGIAKG